MKFPYSNELWKDRGEGRFILNGNKTSYIAWSWEQANRFFRDPGRLAHIKGQDDLTPIVIIPLEEHSTKLV